MSRIRVLIVCMWPWGGIRTYLKYNYHHFPEDEFEITLLANPTVEKRYLKEDMKAENIEVVWARPFLGKNALFFWTAWMLLRRRFDLIHSNGFISAFHVSLVSWLFGIPHVFSIHSILTDKYFRGRLGRFKRFIFRNSLKTVTVLHGVGNDILEYSKTLFPGLEKSRVKWVAIRSGIETERFLSDSPGAGDRLRDSLQVGRNTYIFGFFGRFEPEKGFDCIIEALETLTKRDEQAKNLIVLAMSSGRYEKEYKADIESRGLTGSFQFLPFNPDVTDIMKGCDAILMPSTIEAWGLIACEALCSAIPLIATDVVGLRETIENTPAIRIQPHDSEALAKAMSSVISHPELKDKFKSFREEAARRYDVRRSAEKLIALFKNIIH